jgi:hypothetical protein
LASRSELVPKSLIVSDLAVFTASSACGIRVAVWEVLEKEKAMQPRTEAQNISPARAYNPATDPVLARLRRLQPSRTPKRIVGAIAIVGLLAAAGWYARSAYNARVFENAERAARARAEAEAAAVPVITPFQRVEAWCAANLGGTEFAGLPRVDAGDDRFFVTYTAKAGDSISSVVKRYRIKAASEATTWAEILDLAKQRHSEQYGGRQLWVGDEIWLLVPLQPQDAEVY